MSTASTFVVTDIESDGPDPGRHSMLSFGSVACTADGRTVSEFTANLLPLPDAGQDPGTMTWWASEPEAWRLTVCDRQEPSVAIPAFAAWIGGLPATPVFVAHPLNFDGQWIDWYLRRYVGRRLFRRPRSPGVCFAGGLDLPSMVMTATGWDYVACQRENYPDHWLGGHRHSHRAIDDARGYAHLLALVLDGTVRAEAG